MVDLLKPEPTHEDRVAIATSRVQNPIASPASIGLSDRTGLPADLVERNRADIEAQQNAQMMRKFFSDNTAALDWAVKDHANAALITPDSQSIMADMGRMFNRMGGAFKQNALQNEVSKLSYEWNFRKPTDEEIVKYSELKSHPEYNADYTANHGVLNDFGVTVAGMLPFTYEQVKGGIKGTVIGGVAGGVTGAAVGASTGPGAAASTLVGAKVGAELGAPAGAAYESFKIMSGQASESMRQIRGVNGEMLDPNVIRGASLISGAAQAGLEMLPVGKVLSHIPGAAKMGDVMLGPVKTQLSKIPGFDKIAAPFTKAGLRKVLELPGAQQIFYNFGKRVMDVAATEGVTEGAQQITQIAGEEAAKGLSDGEFKPISLSEAIDQTVTATKYGVMGGIGYGGGAAAANIKGDIQQQREHRIDATKQAADIHATMQKPEAKRFLQETPERAHDYLSHLAGDEKFYIDSDAALSAIGTLPQEQIDALFSAVPDLRTELENAATTGADISIKKADYAAFIAPYMADDTLAQHVKLDPMDKSQYQQAMETAAIQNDPQLVQKLRDAINGVPDPKGVPEQLKAIARNVHQALKAAGRTQTEAADLSQLYAATHRRYADLGLDPMGEFAKKYLGFQSLDSNDNVATKGSNIDVLLSDLEKVRTGKDKRLDDATKAAIADFGDRLEKVGITPEQARTMTGDEVFAKLYAPDPLTQRMDQVINDVQGGADQLGLDLNVRDIAEGIDQIDGVPAAPVEDHSIIKNRLLQAERKNDTHPADKYFDKKALENARNQNDQSRERLVYMKPQDFLDVAMSGTDKTKQDRVTNMVANNERFSDIPSLGFTHDGEGTAVVTSHEGRHRARALMAMGIDKMPVIMRHVYDQNGQALRWGSLDKENFKDTYPKKLYAQVGDSTGTKDNKGKAIDFPVPDPRVLHQDARGYVDFEGMLRKVITTFTSKANFSTGVHEFAHYANALHRQYVQIARAQAAAGPVSAEVQKIIDDWEALKKKVGATSDKFTTDQEEQVAKLFESYMREGVAPSEELRGTFSRFRDWLLHIYQDIKKQLDVELDPETAAIFDSWLASEDAINKVKGKNDVLAQLTETLGLPEDAQKTIMDYLVGAVQNASDRVFRKIRSDQKKRETVEYREKYQRAVKKARDALLETRPYQIIENMEQNGIRAYIGKDTDARLGVPDEMQFAPENAVPVTQADIDTIMSEADNHDAKKQAVINMLLSKQPKQPRSLLGFFKYIGGLKDDGGELKGMDAGKKYPGVINNKTGVPLDIAARAAIEEGYFNQESDIKPDQFTTNDLIEVIGNELRGNKIFAQHDAQAAADFEQYQRAYAQAEEEADRMGINIENERLKRKKWGRYGHLVTTEKDTHGATSVDMLAEMYGYENADAMLAELKATKDIDLTAAKQAREEMAKDYPDLKRNGKLLNDYAIDALYQDKTLTAIDVMIKELGKANRSGQINMKQFAKVIAQTQMAKLKVTEAGYANRWDAARDRELQNALKASKAGDPMGALLSLQKAMVNHMMFKQVTDFAENKEQALELFKKINQRDKSLAGGNDIDFVGAARYILHKFGLASEDFDIAQWQQDIMERDPTVMRDLVGLSRMVSAPAKAAKELTVGEFNDIYDSVKNIMHIAQSLKKIEIKGKEIDRQVIIDELRQQLSQKTQKERANLTQTTSQKALSWVASAKSAARRVEHWVTAMDGGTSGVSRDYIWNPMSKANDTYLDERPKWFKNLHDILMADKKRLEQPGKIAAPEIGHTFTDRLELIGTLLHIGNESNFEKLTDGYKWKGDKFNQMLDRMFKDGTLTDQDMQIVQKLWNLAEKMKPLAQAAHRKLYGYRFDEIEARPLKFTDGKGKEHDYRGGYWPAVVDYTQVEDGDMRRAQDEANGVGNSYMIPTTGKGFTKGRVDGYRRPLSTDLRLATSHIDKILRFAILEPAVRDVSRTVNNREYREELQKVDEFAGRNMLNPWLQRVAQQQTEAPLGQNWNFLAPAARWLRSSASAQVMMFNFLNAIQNVTSFSAVAREVGNRNFAKAFARYVANPMEANREVRDLSRAMRTRQNIEDNAIMSEVNDIILRRGSIKKAKNWAIKHGYIFQRLIQNFVDNVAWMAAFDKYQQENPADATSKAVDYADSLVRRTQGSTSAIDISSIEAGSAPAKLFMMFYSYFNNLANYVGTDANNIIKKSGWKGAPELFYLYIMAYAIPTFGAEFIVKSLKGDYPKDDDDDGEVLDDWLSWFGMSQIRAGVATVPFAGQGANAMINAMNDKPYDDRISLSPVVQMGERAVKFLGKEHSGKGYKDNSHMVADMANTLGFATGLPLGQLGKPLSYIADVKEGDSHPKNIIDWGRGLVVGPGPKK